MWSTLSEFVAVFRGFLNLLIGPGFIFELCSYFVIDVFSGAYLNKFLFLWCPVTANSSQSKGSIRLGAFLCVN
jgi:hypothetical protein